LQRHGLAPEDIERLQKAFQILGHASLNATQGIARIEEEIPQTVAIQELVAFIRVSERGLIN
jgi:acyl-[acyl carrier protein]--UDP-N-acetylglucosamine O-acyltransferase